MRFWHTQIYWSQPPYLRFFFGHVFFPGLIKELVEVTRVRAYTKHKHTQLNYLISSRKAKYHKRELNWIQLCQNTKVIRDQNSQVCRTSNNKRLLHYSSTKWNPIRTYPSHQLWGQFAEKITPIDTLSLSINTIRHFVLDTHFLCSICLLYTSIISLLLLLLN